MLTISWVDLISWFLTIISVVLFVLERKKNKPYYMQIQGVLRALHQKAIFYAAKTGELKKRTQSTIPKDEYLLLIEGVYSDYQSLKQHVMGVLKALEPGQNVPFDTDDFINSKESQDK